MKVDLVNHYHARRLEHTIPPSAGFNIAMRYAMSAKRLDVPRYPSLIE